MWIKAMGGGSAKPKKEQYIVGRLDTMLVLPPSDTSNAYTTKRKWTKNSIFSNMVHNNTYNANYGSIGTRTSNSVVITQGNNSYCGGIVTNCEPNKTYDISWDANSTSAYILIMYYKEDGTFIGSTSVSEKRFTLSVPSDAEYTLLKGGIVGNTAVTFTFITEEVYLYKDGDEHIEITDGFRVWGSYPFEKKENYAEFTQIGNNQTSYIGTTKAISLDGYSKLCAEVTTVSVINDSYDAFYLGLTTEGGTTVVGDFVRDDAKGTRTIKKDISNINGMLCPMLYGNYIANGLLHRIWLEK